MPETFRAKVRTIGTSLGILLPKEIVRREGVKVGEEVEISLWKPLSKKARERLIEKAFGMFKK
jgi:antitoxin component of MazEF toxin-antitoxin module